jgi:hypothetical protein
MRISRNTIVAGAFISVHLVICGALLLSLKNHQFLGVDSQGLGAVLMGLGLIWAINLTRRIL